MIPEHEIEIAKKTLGFRTQSDEAYDKWREIGLRKDILKFAFDVYKINQVDKIEDIYKSLYNLIKREPIAFSVKE